MQHGVPVVDRKVIIAQYLTSYFLLDAASIFPFAAVRKGDGLDTPAPLFKFFRGARTYRYAPAVHCAPDSDKRSTAY